MQKEISTLAQDRMLRAQVRKEKIQQKKIAAVVSASKKKIPSPRGGVGLIESALVLAEIEKKMIKSIFYLEHLFHFRFSFDLSQDSY